MINSPRSGNRLDARLLVLWLDRDKALVLLDRDTVFRQFRTGTLEHSCESASAIAVSLGIPGLHPPALRFVPS